MQPWTDAEVEALADELWAARRSGRLVPPPSTRRELDLATAYEVQRRVVARLLASGDEVVGWKLGYTSEAMRAQMGVAGPNHGPLTRSMLLPAGTDVGDAYRQPRVEPEVAVRLGHDLPPGSTEDDVRSAAAEVLAALEVVDSSYPAYRFTLADNTADLSSAAAVVLGPALDQGSLTDLAVDLYAGGDRAAHGEAAAAMGHPFRAVAWLAGELAERGGLRAGQLVITGGLTHAVALEPGSSIEAVFSTGQRVSVRRAVPPPRPA